MMTGWTWDGIATVSAVTANPAAGSDPATLTVTAARRWHLTSLYSTLVTDATVITRIAKVTYTDGTGPIYAIGYGNQAASAAYVYSAAINAPLLTPASYSGFGMVPLPDMDLMAGATVAISTTNLQAGDDWGALRYTYKEKVET